MTAVALLAMSVVPAFANGGTTYYSDLWAGRDHTDVGSVTVVWTGNILHITYMTEGCWRLVETHLAVGESLEDIPQTNSGNPKIGHFPYSEEHNPTVTEYTYDVDVGASSGLFYVAAHAVVCCTCNDRCETAWGQGLNHAEFPGNSWALYFTIED